MTRRTPAQYNWGKLEFDETILTKHFTAQASKAVKYVVVHHMTIIGNGTGSALTACFNTWQNREASAHYGVDGALVRQFVWDKDYAWATGSTDGNRYGISIEHANSALAPKWTVADDTWKTGARLAAHLHRQYKLGRPVKDETLRKHGSFVATACPGPHLGGTIWSAYVIEAQRVYDEITGAKPVVVPLPPVCAAPVPVPPKPAPSIAEATVLTLNLAAKAHLWQRRTWKTRLPELAKIINTADADIVAIQEAGSIGYVKALDARIRRFKRSPGKGAPLYNRWRYLYHNPLRYRCLKSGLMTLNKIGSKHAAWALFQDIKTGKTLFVTSVHLTAGGASTDKKRLSEARTLIAKTRTLNTTNAPVVHAGDFNSASFVGGAIMLPAGFKDTLITADDVTNRRFDSCPGWDIKAGRQRANDADGWHLDHIYAQVGIDTRTWELIRAIKATDHDGVSCTIRF